jgi:carbohydrate kinase (thermoresistant glucokinase family)
MHNKPQSGASQDGNALLPIIVVMGVAGAGKTTVGSEIARRFGYIFADADEFHSPANITKMKAGTPLTDADRQSWLEAIAARIQAWRAEGIGGVVACSALKRVYRDLIIGGRPGIVLVYLKGDADLIRSRMAKRRGHFMPPSLLDSQFATLEEPGADEHPIVLDATRPAPELVQEVWHGLARPT